MLHACGIHTYAQCRMQCNAFDIEQKQWKKFQRNSKNEFKRFAHTWNRSKAELKVGLKSEKFIHLSQRSM